MRAQAINRKKEQVLAAAEDVFLEWGYPNTTVDMIVEKSGASKQTVYVYFASKEEIFRSVIERLKAATELKIDSSKLRQLDLEELLTAIATTLLKQVQSTDFTKFLWLVTGECSRFPYLREVYIKEFVSPVLEATETYAGEHPQIHIEDPRAAAFYFRGAITSFSLFANLGFGFTEKSAAPFLKTLISSFASDGQSGIRFDYKLEHQQLEPLTLRRGANGKRDQILNGALDLFLQKGFRDSAMNEVSLRAAVSKPTVYAHFNNKELLFQAIHEQLLDQIKERLTVDPAVFKTSADFLCSFAANFLEVLEDCVVRDYFRVLFGEPARLRTYVNAALEVLLLLQSEQIELAIANVAGRDPDQHHYSAAIFNGALVSYSLVQQVYTDADLLDLDRRRFLKELIYRISRTR